MSRYLILIILNTPLIVAGIIDAIVLYKLKKSTKRRLIFRLAVWSVILFGLIFMHSVYSFLFSHNLTQTEPLSLFDVMQITGIIVTFFIANQAFTKSDLLERRVQDLHQELSILLSKDKNK